MYGSDERFSGSECLALEARLKVRRKFVRADNVARVARPVRAFGGPMPRMSVLRPIFHRSLRAFEHLMQQVGAFVGMAKQLSFQLLAVLAELLLRRHLQGLDEVAPRPWPVFAARVEVPARFLGFAPVDSDHEKILTRRSL